MMGRKVGDTTFKVHLDGYNLLPALKGEGPWPRHEFLYWTDDGSVAALGFNNWKVTFLRQNARGMHVWTHPFEELRAPSLTNLRMDPFELAEQEMTMGYQRWWAERMFALGPRVVTLPSGFRASGSSRRVKSLVASISTK